MKWHGSFCCTIAILLCGSVLLASHIQIPVVKCNIPTRGYKKYTLNKQTGVRGHRSADLYAIKWKKKNLKNNKIVEVSLWISYVHNILQKVVSQTVLSASLIRLLTLLRMMDSDHLSWTFQQDRIHRKSYYMLLHAETTCSTWIATFDCIFCMHSY